MVSINFSKYQGTGNDFILIDNRDNSIELTRDQIAQLCDRRFGIGADGLMLLEKFPGYDFKMVYYNSDGGESTMCGNGGRCIVMFAKRLGVIDQNANFLAIDGPHEAIVSNDLVELGMIDVDQIQRLSFDTLTLNTGSPHFVKFCGNVSELNVFEEGRKIRYNETFKEKGINVNFVEQINDKLIVRTYERGVEDETYSCGTGVTAAALASQENSPIGNYHISVETLGGNLNVRFSKVDQHQYKNIFLIGPATMVFNGFIEI